MASADELTLPRPAIPKTLGILNVIFAVLLILVGTCTGIGALLAPEIQKFGQGVAEKAKKQAEDRKAAELKDIDDRAKAATTDAEKAAIDQERDAVTSRPLPITPNVVAPVDTFKDPTVRTYMVASLVTGLILHVTLLVAGIGLIRLTGWGRTLGLWWAGLQVAQLLILGVAHFTLIQPIQQKTNEATMAEMKRQLTGPNAPPNAAFTVQVMETTAKLGPALAGLYYLAALTYPVLCLVLLRTAGARAACLGPGPGPATYPAAGL